MATSSIKVRADIGDQIKMSRAVRDWINDAHVAPGKVQMEYLPDGAGIAIAVSETPYITRRYITGGYQAAYEFDLVFRTTPVTDDERLRADEKLNEIAQYMTHNAQTLHVGERVRVRRVQQQSVATLQARFNNGVEDHAVHITISYEVVK